MVSLVGSTSLVPTLGIPYDTYLKAIAGIDWFMTQELSGSVAYATNSALATGRDLVREGSFPNDPGVWTLSAPWTITGGKCTFDDTASNQIYQAVPLGVSRIYEIGFTIADLAAGTAALAFNDSSGGNPLAANGTFANGAHTVTTFAVPAGYNGNFAIFGLTDSTGSFSITNITIKQTGILASSAYAPGTNPMDGRNTACAVGQLADGNLGYAYALDGATSYLDLTSAEFNSILNPLAADGFEELLFVQKDTWDVTERDILSYTVDANNWIRIVDTTTVGTISFQFRAGGTTKEVLLVLGATPPTSWMLLGISVKNNVLSAWYNGALVGTIAIVTTFVGNFVTMLIGARTTTPTFVHLGQVTRIGAASRELSTVENYNIWQGSGLA